MPHIQHANVDLTAKSAPIAGSNPLRGYLATPSGTGPWPGVVHDVKEYPNAGHAFLNDAASGPRPLRPLLRVAGMGPQPAAAADAWHRIDEFFDTHLRSV